MRDPITDLRTLLSSLDPHLHEGVYVYSSVATDTDLSSLSVVGTFREDDELTVILPEEEAMKAGFPILFRAAWITLMVDSSLDAVGLTAAFSTALGEAGISCNVVAGARHDHVFVPVEKSAEAIDAIKGLSK